MIGVSRRLFWRGSISSCHPASVLWQNHKSVFKKEKLNKAKKSTTRFWRNSQRGESLWTSSDVRAVNVTKRNQEVKISAKVSFCDSGSNFRQCSLFHWAYDHTVNLSTARPEEHPPYTRWKRKLKRQDCSSKHNCYTNLLSPSHLPCHLLPLISGPFHTFLATFSFEIKKSTSFTSEGSEFQPPVAVQVRPRTMLNVFVSHVLLSPLPTKGREKKRVMPGFSIYTALVRHAETARRWRSAVTARNL